MVSVLQTLISEISPLCTIGAEWVSEDTAYPYAVYSYFTNEEEFKTIGTITLDLWDKGTSRIPVETLASNIRKKLDRKKFQKNDVFVWFYFDTQSTIQDEVPEIKRIRIQFDVFFYRK